ncbi:MAG: TlpA family protein disulfide reductase [Candidatus Eremiobacteraeota bacterium]|nr:TlpA family protein disulfide reductase [Candidatus Eremiobacteraeota bacterium]
MNQRSIGIVTAAIVALIVAGSIAWYALKASHRLQSASQSPIVGKAALGQTAPQFEVPTTQGVFNLDQSTKPVFLEVFATWCPHCQRETAVIDKLYDQYKDRVDFVGVSGSDTAMDGTSPASQLDVVNWIDKFHVTYPVAYDANLTVANLYLQGGFPTMAVIGKNKQIAYLNSGEISYDELKTALDKALSS